MELGTALPLMHSLEADLCDGMTLLSGGLLNHLIIAASHLSSDRASTLA